MTAPIIGLNSLTSGKPSLPTTLPPVATKYGLLSFAAKKKATAQGTNPLASAAATAVANAEAAASGASTPGSNASGATNGTATTGASSGADSLTNNQSITEQDFMKLLVTQLQNQDPLNPQQPYELAAELAQFTSVSELDQLNTTVSGQATDITSNTDAVQQALSTSLIGQNVIATGNQIDVLQGANTATFMAGIGGSGGAASVTLTNANGVTVGTYKLGNVGGGQQVMSIPDNGLAPGAYTYSLTVTDASGNAVATTPYTAGQVNAVSISNGVPSLQIGDMTVPVSNLVEVIPPATSSPSN